MKIVLEREDILGRILQLKCEGCGFIKELFIDGGRMDCELETILLALSGDERQTLREAAHRGARWISIVRKPYNCPNCQTPYALPIVTYFLNDQEFRLYGTCPKCGRTGGEPTEAALSCPNCGTVLSECQTGRWD